MSGAESFGNRDIKKLLGNPKITFVLGNHYPYFNSVKVVLLQAKVHNVQD
jgi:hypothetical protein